MLLAFVITFLFVFFVLPKNTESQAREEKLEMLSLVQYDPLLRECSIDYNVSCINSSLTSNFPDSLINYNCIINISAKPDNSIRNLPPVDVIIDSLFIMGDDDYSPRIIKIFYWKKQKS